MAQTDGDTGSGQQPQANTTPAPAIPRIQSIRNPPRLVVRNFPFNQSQNILQVEHDQGLKITRLTQYDFFHVLLRLPTFVTVLVLVILSTASGLFFAAMYYAIDPDEAGTDCRLRSFDKPILFATAFANSIQTASGVGYTLPLGVNSYYENCPKLQIVTYVQMSVSMMLNAFIVATLIAKMKNAAKRATQVVFGEKAVVSLVKGQVRLMIRVFDVNARHPVVGAHVSLYAVKKDRAIPRALRLLQPNDAIGGGLLLSLPQVVSHHIDLYSILHSPRPDNILPKHNSGLDLRQADSSTCGRDDVVCRVCGETFGTYEQWTNHVRYKQIVERQAGTAASKGHRGINQVELELNCCKPTTNLQVLKAHFEQEISEVVCVVEGTDPLTSGAFCAMQSYRASDIVWETQAAFVPCISVDAGIYLVDLERFHDIANHTVPGGRQHQLSSRVHDSFFADQDNVKQNSLTVPQ